MVIESEGSGEIRGYAEREHEHAGSDKRAPGRAAENKHQDHQSMKDFVLFMIDDYKDESLAQGLEFKKHGLSDHATESIFLDIMTDFRKFIEFDDNEAWK